MKTIGIGMIGAGNIAHFHLQGYHSVREAYGDIEPEFVVIADTDEAAARDLANKHGFKKVTTDWHEVVNDPDVQVVLIVTPNYLHAEMAIAAAKAGKHVMCEKPMAMTREEGKAMVQAVKDAGVISQVDFIYCKCPVIVQAKKMIEAGQLGDIVSFRGWFDASYKADPNSPMEWRQYAKYAGTGAMGDVTAHLISLSDFMLNGQLGGIDEVCAVWDVVYPNRPAGEGQNEIVPVDTDDQNYVLLRYKNGRIGVMMSSRVATGHDCRMGFEIHGSKGSAAFSLNRINELEVFEENCGKDMRGFKTLSPNTAHGEYKNFSIYDDMGISYANVMGIQAHSMLNAVVKNEPLESDIAYGYYVDRVMDAMVKSIEERRWVKIEEML